MKSLKLLLKIIRWIIGIVLILACFGGYMNGDTIQATVVLVVGILILPIRIFRKQQYSHPLEANNQLDSIQLSSQSFSYNLPAEHVETGESRSTRIAVINVESEKIAESSQESTEYMQVVVETVDDAIIDETNNSKGVEAAELEDNSAIIPKEEIAINMEEQSVDKAESVTKSLDQVLQQKKQEVDRVLKSLLLKVSSPERQISKVEFNIPSYEDISVIKNDSIEIVNKEERINYNDEPITVSWPVHNDESNSYYNEDWKLGKKYKNKLNLTTQEVSWLNKFWNPYNVFISIEGCCVATIKLYLSCLKEINKSLRKQETTVAKEIERICDKLLPILYPGYTRHNGMHSYYKEGIESNIYLTLFKRAENAVREAYNNKRKINDVFGYVAGIEDFEKVFGTVADKVINNNKGKIEQPDEETELTLNSQNPTRWKISFESIISKLNDNTYPECVQLIDELAKRNLKNPSLEYIFYEASKCLSKVNKLEAIKFYLKYLYADLNSGVIDNKQLNKTIQKGLFKSEDELKAFESIANQLLKDKDLDKALSNAPTIYEKKRKKIQLDRNAILEVKSQHSETVVILNEMLSDNEEINLDRDTSEVIEIKLEKVNESLTILNLVAELDLNLNQQLFLKLFQENNFLLSADAVTNFAKSKGIFKSQLIDSLNEACYDLLDDVLIEEIGDNYEIDQSYFNKIQNL